MSVATPKKNADIMQSFLSDDLLSTPQSISDVKQVLDFMRPVAQPLSQPQIQALLLLESLGTNDRLHGNKNPYKPLIDAISKDYKQAVAETGVYLETIMELVPKPPRPIVVAGGEQPKKGGK